MSIVYALLSALFASLTAIFAKIGIRGVDSDLATAVRTVIILLLAWSIAFSRGATSGLASLTRMNWIFLVLSAIATGLSWIFYFRAIQLGNVYQVAAIDKLSVALTLILAAVFFREPLGVKAVTGVSLIVAGTLVLVWK
jgi:transporter family protein